MIREKNRSFLSMFDNVEYDEDGGDIVMVFCFIKVRV